MLKSRDFERNIQLGTCTHRICPSYSIYSLEIIIKIRVMKPMKFNNSLIKSMISKFCSLINNLIFQMISQKFNLRKWQRCKICKILAMKPTPDISWKVNITDYLSASISDLVRIISAVKMIFYPLDMSHFAISGAKNRSLWQMWKISRNFRRFYLDFWSNWDRFSFNKISVKIPIWQNHHFWNV